MGMSGSLLRPSASALHPEALAWRSAAIANGGSVSGSTMTAVNTFCKAIDAAGIRSLLYRVNLFAGTGLPACLVPLYRGPSRTGTQYGNTTDTNVNFVSGDYGETTGLGDASNTNKYLATGLIPFNAGLTEQNYHNSGWFPSTLTTSGEWIGASGTGGSAAFSIFFPAFSTFGMYVRFGGSSNSGLENAALAARNGLLMGQRSSGAGVGYRNGANLGASSVTTGSVAMSTNQPPALNVFARNANGTPSSYFAGKSYMYSVGNAMTDAQALAFYNALLAFNQRVGRA